MVAHEPGAHEIEIGQGPQAIGPCDDFRPAVGLEVLGMKQVGRKEILESVGGVDDETGKSRCSNESQDPETGAFSFQPGIESHAESEDRVKEQVGKLADLGESESQPRQ